MFLLVTVKNNVHSETIFKILYLLNEAMNRYQDLHKGLRSVCVEYVEEENYRIKS